MACCNNSNSKSNSNSNSNESKDFSDSKNSTAKGGCKCGPECNCCGGCCCKSSLWWKAVLLVLIAGAIGFAAGRVALRQYQKTAEGIIRPLAHTAAQGNTY